MAVAFTLGMLTKIAAGHFCRDRSQVTCMDVKNLDVAPSSYGETWAASGFPLCTPEGRKVFCLVDHDYHQCNGHRVPCCFDGSRSVHHGVEQSEGSDDTLECATRSVTEDALDAHAVSSTEPPSTTPLPLTSAAALEDLEGKDAVASVAAEVGGRQGSLKLQASSSLHHGSTPLRFTLLKHKTILEEVLELHLAREVIEVKSIEVTQARRLAESHGSAQVEVIFTASRGATTAIASHDLPGMLQNGLDQVHAGVEIDSATVSWYDVATLAAGVSGGARDNGTSSVIYIAIAVAVISVTSVALALAVCCLRRRKGGGADSSKSAGDIEEAKAGFGASAVAVESADVDQPVEAATVEDDFFEKASASTDVPMSDATSDGSGEKPTML